MALCDPQQNLNGKKPILFNFLNYTLYRMWQGCESLKDFVGSASLWGMWFPVSGVESGGSSHLECAVGHGIVMKPLCCAWRQVTIIWKHAWVSCSWPWPWSWLALATSKCSSFAVSCTRRQGERWTTASTWLTTWLWGSSSWEEEGNGPFPKADLSPYFHFLHFPFFFFNIIWMHQGVFCWKRDSCCLHALLKVPFLIPPKYFVLLWFLEGKLKDSDFFPTDIPWALPTPPLLLFSVLCTLTSLFTARTIGKAFVGIPFPSAESSSYKRQMMDFYQKNQFLEVLH